MARFQLKPENRKIEAETQKVIVQHLRGYLPTEIKWTCSLSGLKVPMQVAVRAKAMGMNKGAPDLSFIFPDRLTRYIDVKAPGGRPTPEQAELAELLGPLMAFVESWPQARDVLATWMRPMGLRFLTDTEAVRRGLDMLQARR